jgi:hypothetical protein
MTRRNEFAIYDAVLQELAVNAQNVPLGSAQAAYDYGSDYTRAHAYSTVRTAHLMPKSEKLTRAKKVKRTIIQNRMLDHGTPSANRFNWARPQCTYGANWRTLAGVRTRS